MEKDRGRPKKAWREQIRNNMNELHLSGDILGIRPAKDALFVSCTNDILGLFIVWAFSHIFLGICV